MTAIPKPGDKVKWNTAGGETEGTVEEVVTQATRVKGHAARATRDRPEVLVRSDKSGRQAVHKPDALTKR